MIKNDPYRILKEEKIAKKLLGEHVMTALKEYDETLEELKEFSSEKSLMEIAEQIGAVAVDLVKEDIERIKKGLNDDVEKKQEQEVRKAQSKKVKQKVLKDLDYLAECRRNLREERKRKIESGEIKAPVKKRLSTKLKERLQNVVRLIPKEVLEDKNKIDQIEKATLEYLSKLKQILGMNSVKPIEKALKEGFDEMEEKAKKRDRKDLVKKWKSDLDDFGKEVKKSLEGESLETFKEDMENLEHTRKLLVENPSQAAKFLKDKFDKDQIDSYLPDYIKEELNIKSL